MKTKHSSKSNAAFSTSLIKGFLVLGKQVGIYEYYKLRRGIYLDITQPADEIYIPK